MLFRMSDRQGVIGLRPLSPLRFISNSLLLVLLFPRSRSGFGGGSKPAACCGGPVGVVSQRDVWQVVRWLEGVADGSTVGTKRVCKGV